MPSNKVQVSRAQPYSTNAVRSGEVRQGAILYIPTDGVIQPRASKLLQIAMGQDFINKVAGDHGSKNRFSFFKHPILVISRPASDPYTIHFLVMRGFDKTSLEQTPQVTDEEYQYYVPLAPSKSHPFCTAEQPDDRYKPISMVYWLKNPGSHSYVCAREIWEMDWRVAERFYDAERPNERHPWAVSDIAPLLSVTEELTGYTPGPQIEQQWSEHLDLAMCIFASLGQRAITSFFRAMVDLPGHLGLLLQWVYWAVIIYVAIWIAIPVLSAAVSLLVFFKTGLDGVLAGSFRCLLFVSRVLWKLPG